MKTTRTIACTLVILCAASSAFAGPGIQYWRSKPTPEAKDQVKDSSSESSTKADTKSAKAKTNVVKKSAKAN